MVRVVNRFVSLVPLEETRAAAEQGNAQAQYDLGCRFFDGREVERDVAEAAKWFRKAAEQGEPSACERYAMMLSKGAGVRRNCDEALVWLRKCPNMGSARRLIALIERSIDEKMRGARELVDGIRAGDCVSVAMPGGNTLLHAAAENLTLDMVAFLFEHPGFDDLVVRPNGAGKLACEIIGDCSASERGGATAHVIASVLSCRRSTRAACLLWCLEQVGVPTVGRPTVLPREVSELVARFVVPPRGAVDRLQLTCDAAQLVQSVQSEWRRAPASVGETLLRDRQAAVRSETRAIAHLAWLRAESRSLWTQVLAGRCKLGELVRMGSFSSLQSEQNRVEGLCSRLKSVEGERRALARQLRGEAFAAELAFLQAEAQDLDEQLRVSENDAAGHAARRDFRLAAAATEATSLLQERLAEVEADLSDIRAEAERCSAGSGESEGVVDVVDDPESPESRGEKRGHEPAASSGSSSVGGARHEAGQARCVRTTC
jgi:Sel1 repeat